MRTRARCLTWRSFDSRGREAIEAQLRAGREAACPRCGGLLEAQPGTRLAAVLPGKVAGYDLACRRCRQFHPRVIHTPRSRYLLRLRRLAAAVRRA